MFICSSSLCVCAFGGGKSGTESRSIQRRMLNFSGTVGGCILLLMHSTLRLITLACCLLCCKHRQILPSDSYKTRCYVYTEQHRKEHTAVVSSFTFPPSLFVYMDTDVTESRHHRGFSTVWGASAVVTHAKRCGLLRGERTIQNGEATLSS